MPTHQSEIASPIPVVSSLIAQKSAVTSGTLEARAMLAGRSTGCGVLGMRLGMSRNVRGRAGKVLAVRRRSEIRSESGTVAPSRGCGAA